MPQTGKRNPKDPYDARNPGVRPYRGSTDSELEAEERGRRDGIDPAVAAAVSRGTRQPRHGKPRIPPSMETPPDYGGPGMPREPGMMEPWEKPVTSTHAGSVVDHLEKRAVSSKGAEDDPVVGGGKAGPPVTGPKSPRWNEYMRKRK